MHVYTYKTRLPGGMFIIIARLYYIMYAGTLFKSYVIYRQTITNPRDEMTLSSHIRYGVGWAVHVYKYLK